MTALTFSAHYFLISAPTAIALNFLSAVICLYFAFRNKKQGESKVEVITTSVLIAVAGMLAWENIYSVFLIAGLVTSTVSLSFSNPQNTRWAMFIKSPLCIIYNIAVSSMGGVIYECVVIIYNCISIFCGDVHLIRRVLHCISIYGLSLRKAHSTCMLLHNCRVRT